MMQIAGLAVGYRSGSLLERTFRDLRSASLNIGNDRLLTINGTLGFVDRSVTLL
jgi:acyl-CoA dehydrogenase